MLLLESLSQMTYMYMYYVDLSRKGRDNLDQILQNWKKGKNP